MRRIAYSCNGELRRRLCRCPVDGITNGVWEQIRAAIKDEVKAFGSILV